GLGGRMPNSSGPWVALMFISEGGLSRLPQAASPSIATIAMAVTPALACINEASKPLRPPSYLKDRPTSRGLSGRLSSPALAAPAALRGPAREDHQPQCAREDRH